jgi:hypothetical protein
MPVGTPVIVNGIRIGYSGNTGNSTGPHLHVSRYKDGRYIPPGNPFALPGFRLYDTGQDSSSGIYARLKALDGSMYIYCHLSKVGQQSAVLPVTTKVNEDMITPQDVNLLRVGHSEIGGWDFQKTHSGQYDGQFVSTWQGKTWQEFISNQWARGEAYRNGRIATYARAEALNSENQALKSQAAKLDATIKELQTLKDALQSDDERDKQLITSQVNKIEALTKDLQDGQAKVKTVQATTVPLWLKPLAAFAAWTARNKA